IFYRRYRYIITSDKVDVRRGIIIVRHTVVPIERIHQVEVVSGPINNMLGLADVNITTAGGITTIEYLEKDVADTVAEELNRVVEKILKDRKKND
ncbi:MAG: PH domain-containing protein, partial [Candidatus Methanomethylophilaceae archaeon]